MAKTKRQKELGHDPAVQISTVNPTGEGERCYIHVKKYHHHGVIGKLIPGEVYDAPKMHAEQINKDFPGVLDIIEDRGEAQKLVDKRREKMEQEIARRKKEQEEQEKAKIKEAGRAQRRA